MSHVVDLYWSFRSGYSYLVTHRLVVIERAYEADIRIRIVAPPEAKSK